jgi:hypothetical protein
MSITPSDAPLPTVSPSRIRTLSRVLGAVCLLGIVALPVAVGVQWAILSPEDLFANVQSHVGSGTERITGPVEGWQRLIGAAVSMIPVAFTLIGLNHARRCFSLFAKGVFFDSRAVLALRGFAGMSALSVAAGLVLQGPLTALVSYNNPPGQRYVSIGLGTHDLDSLFFAGMVWLIAAVMAKAVLIARENDQFV